MTTTYDIAITYTRPSGTDTQAFYSIEAHTPRRAKQLARKELINDPKRRVASIVDVAVVGGTVTGRVASLHPFPYASLPKIIHAGEVLSIPRDPLVGRVRHWLNGKGIDLIDDAGQRVASIRRDMVEERTGRTLEAAPPPVETKYHITYPTGETYVQDFPTKSSSYGVENLVIVKIVRQRGSGKLVSSEIVR